MMNGCAVWYYTLIFLTAAKISIWSFDEMAGLI